MNSPVDPALLQLVQQDLKFLQDNVDNLSVEFDQEKVKVQQELKNAVIILQEMKQTVQRFQNFQGNHAYPLQANRPLPLRAHLTNASSKQ